MTDEIDILSTPGGIPVIIERLPFTHSASFSTYFGTGSRDESDDQAGMAHMLEHMLFKGTKKRTARQMSEDIEAAGGEQNGYTTKEVTAYQAYALDETAEVAEDVLADMVLQPLLSKECLDVERNVVVQEIRMLENDPGDYVHVLFNKTLWGEHPMGRSEAGSVSTVSSFTEEDIRSFFHERYRPPKLAVVAVGNVDKKQVMEWASSSFDGLEARSGQDGRSAPVPQARFSIYPRDDKQAYVGIGFPGLSAVHPDRFAQRLLATLLGMGTSSRLFQEVRERSGLVYEIYASSGNYTDCGTFSVFYSTAVKDQERVARLVAKEIARLKKEGLEKGELQRSKHLIKGSYVRRLESTESRMIRLGEMFMATGEAIPPEETLRRMDRVTEEEVLKAAEHLLVRNKLALAMHAPKKESEEQAKSLEDLDF